ncbi:MAG: hypothetical protein N2746_07215 [Deltaproteobacteria bacterium]|nr:hypothetical protein [Deltaproteobacteria bacterium]
MRDQTVDGMKCLLTRLYLEDRLCDCEKLMLLRPESSKIIIGVMRGFDLNG